MVPPSPPIELQVLMPPPTFQSQATLTGIPPQARRSIRKSSDQRSISSEPARRPKHRDDVFRRGE